MSHPQPGAPKSLTNEKPLPPAWKPDRRFWMNHGLLPLAAALVVLTLLEQTGIDLWLADRWFALEGGQWSWRNHWITYDLIHHHGKQLIIGIAISAIALLLLGLRFEALAHWRRPLAYLLVCMLLLPALIAFGKRFSTVLCPWDLARYGGSLLYQHNLEYAPAYRQVGHCFPSGHASGGFALLALYFAGIGRVRRPAWLLLPGLVIGGIFALGQQARGAHFLSHDLWTLSICWFGALLAFALLRPDCAVSLVKVTAEERRNGAPA